MRQCIFIFLTTFLFSHALFAQPDDSRREGEFTVHDNGLIYSPQTMSQLNHIVDSLNLKFKVCEPKRFVTVPQAHAVVVSLDSLGKKARKDLQNGMKWEDFTKKYPFAKVNTEGLIIRDMETNDNGRVDLTFQEFNAYRVSIDNTPENRSDKVKNKWFFDNSSDSEYLTAFFFLTDFESKPLPDRVARLVQYADCLVDTNTTIFFPQANRGYDWTSPKKEVKLPPNLTEFKAAFDICNRDRPNYEQFEKKNKKKSEEAIEKSYDEAYKKWETLQQARIDSFERAPNFLPLLKNALAEALRDTISDSVLEDYAQKHNLLTAENQLFFNRNRIVYGQCSQDASPRYHAQKIAVLAAETTNWEVFLRAHLNIMNDRFPRVSDGSYAWAKRKTYIRELEELGINVNDLLLGISFSAENAAKNHYFGNISRLGRALSETKNPQEIEKAMFAAIEDASLDDLNRLRMYYLFLNYNYNLADATQKQKNKTLLAASVAKLPPYLKQYLEKEED